MSQFEKMAGTRTFIITMLLSQVDEEDLDEVSAEYSAMSNDELKDEFCSAGYVQDEESFEGVFETIPEDCIDIEAVGDVTGWQASLTTYYEIAPNPKMR